MENDPLGTGPVREEDDDYDLLTFGEAGVRLAEEIAALEILIQQMESVKDCNREELDLNRTRLKVLRGAAERNARQPINDENFTKFFGYEGKARRNTK